MDLADVMDEVGNRVDVISGLRVYPYPADNPQVPAAIVTYPDTYTYDETYGRGMDQIGDLAVVVLVGKVSDRASRDQIGAYANGSGDRSIKQAVDTENGTAFDTATVTQVEFDIVRMAGVDYLAATFSIDIAGQGTA